MSAGPSTAPRQPGGRSRCRTPRRPSTEARRAPGASRSSLLASSPPMAKPKERTLSGPAETPSNRATSSRNGGRNHLGTPSDIKSEWWARSSRNPGRLPSESAGSAMTHHPHIHMIVPGGGISLDNTHWVSCRSGFLLPVRVLSRLFRRLFLTGLADAHAATRLVFFGDLDCLRDRTAFTAHLAPLRKKNWFVYAKPPFAGPEAVLAYLARYTHRVAISNSRLIGLDERGVTFRYKDYRHNGRARYRTMTLAPDEFIRRFLLHTLPKGFHRIRHYGLLASAGCNANIARARELIAAPVRSEEHTSELQSQSNIVCRLLLEKKKKKKIKHNKRKKKKNEKKNQKKN